MRDTARNELNRAVSLLNFELENMSKAKNVLAKKYKIPQFYLTLIAHKIFHRLGTCDFTWPPKGYATLWDQFHLIALEEMRILNFQQQAGS